MGPYQRCPYCEAVIDIGEDGKGALERHIRVEHTDDEHTDDERTNRRRAT